MAVDSACNKSGPSRNRFSQDALAAHRIDHRQKNTSAGAGQAGGTAFPQPVERFADLRVQPAHHRLKIVVPRPSRKARIVIGGVWRVNSESAKTSAVETLTGGFRTT